MAFDLVQYFVEQTKIQKPQLLKQYPAEQRHEYLNELNILALGKLIGLWRKDEKKIYQEIHAADQLYIQEVARHLTTSQHNQSTLSHQELETATSEILTLQLNELKQLDVTGHYQLQGMNELLQGQVEHLSGKAKDWVWLTNNLNELIGSQPVIQEEISLDQTMKEFHDMVNQVQHDHHDVAEPEVVATPTWAKVLEPVVAIAILWVLYCAVQTVFA
ncbi:hypothetical protein [Acinetobacter sp. DSM 11652]|uniref:hypothetical protein n=1 Tax=Acinetobacter sp. DSM 11652 TaxID=346222 RepID=UPI0008CC9D44|nr:hypothetical protein [Acinetobacter sp. DSM 11652]SEM25098.1 hypothetical protein SAMN05216500_11610 [Acinetobacter sp. DSM 11652]